MNIFRILVVEPNLEEQQAILMRLNSETPAGVKCKVDLCVNVHQAIHLLHGYAGDRIPHLIIASQVREEPRGEEHAITCCLGLHEISLQEAVTGLRLHIPICEYRNAPPNVETRHDALIQAYLAYLGDVYPQTGYRGHGTPAYP